METLSHRFDCLGTVGSVRERLVTMDENTFKELKWLLKTQQCRKTGWVRHATIINQRRRKVLNDAFKDAGLDEFWCEYIQGAHTWDGKLHLLWHRFQLVGV